jgi:putative endonuclease
MKLRQFYVYILTNAYNTVLYIGVTGNLLSRVYQHKEASVDGFAKRYSLKKLVYYEICGTAQQAIAREKQLKNWHRQWKINLIQAGNKDMHDLYNELILDSETSSE